MTDKTKQPGRGTTAVWGGEEGPFWEGSTQVPVVSSVSFGYTDMENWMAVGKGQAPGHIYSRNTNPTVRVFEDKVCRLEGAEAGVSFASGMAAISNLLFCLLSPGDRMVSIKDSYGGTNRLFTEFLPRFKIDVALCDTADHETIEAAVAAGCRLLYLESPTNPTLKVVDIERLARAAHDQGAVVAVDNTFATPINQQPLNLGADLTLHSATKFLGGHADVLGGIVCGPKDLVDRIYHFREINGAALAPAAAYQLLRSLKTLHLRVREQNQNALAVATFLEDHAEVTGVFYPGLKSNAGHEIAVRQMNGFGGVLSFQVKGGMERVKKLLPLLNYAHCAANLGAVETVVGPPAMTSHVECTAEERAAMGIPESLIRYSVGIEDVDDLIQDLDQALLQTM